MKLRLSLCVLICIASVLSAGAVTKKWTGAVSNNWHTAGNWSPAGVPATGDDVDLFHVAGYTGVTSPTPLISGTASIRNLRFDPDWGGGVSLTLNSGGNLTVTGSFTLNNTGQLIISGGNFNHTGTSYSTSANTSISMSSGSFSTNAAFTANGTFTATAGNLNFNGGFTLSNNFSAGNSNMYVDGNFTINQNFSIGSGSLTVDGNLTVSSGKSFTAQKSRIIINGNLTLNNSNSSFHAGSDSVTINGALDCKGNTFYGDTAVIAINGNGGTNSIEGNFYTNAAHISFNPNSFTDIRSGGRFYVNSGTVKFVDSVRIGNNGKLFAGTGSVTFYKSLLVSANGELTAQSGTMNFEGNASFSNNGTLNAGSATINFGGDVIIDNNNGTINADSAVIGIAGDITNTGSFNAGTSTVILNGDSSQSISADIVFYNLNIETNGTVQAGGNVTVLNGGTIGSNAEISIPDPDDQFNVQGDLVDSSGSLAVATNKPFVTGITVIDSVTIVVVFNETVTKASVENAANSTWTGRTISSRTHVDSNKLRLVFTPAIVKDVEYTLVFQNIQNVRNPVGTMSAGHEKRFTWATPATPATSSSNLSFTGISSSSFNLSWTKGSGSNRLVIARQDSAVNFTPLVNILYIPNDSFGRGTNLGNGNYAVYSGSGSSFSLKGLSTGTTYHFAIYEFNGTTGNLVYQSAAPLTGSQSTAFGAPSVQASNLQVAGSSDTSITLSWTSGNGSLRLVLARASTSISTSPVNGTSYTGDTNFGQGSQLGSNTFVVYKGSGNTANITGLQANTRYFLQVIEYNGAAGLEAYNIVSIPELGTHTHIRVDIKVFLEGPFNDSTLKMNTRLSSSLSDSQVFNAAPWNYAGWEAVEEMPHDSVVDWVLVEMRQASLPNQAVDTNVVGRRAGLLLSNGKIVDLDGVSPLLIPTNRSGRMYAVVYHRTHIPVQSADSLSRSQGRYIYDFTTNVNGAYGNSNPLKELSTGIYGMYCGRVATNTTDSIGVSDRTAAWDERNTLGYHPADVNLDGVVDAGDRSIIWNNYGVEKEVAE